MKGKWKPWRALSSKDEPVFTSENGNGSTFPAFSSGYGKKIQAAKSELQKVVKPSRLHPMAMGLFIAVLILLASWISEMVIYETSLDSMKDMIRGNLKRLARAGATLVDPDLHKTLTHPEMESSEAYKKAIAPLKTFQDSDTEIAFVYTCVEKDGRIYFVLDPTPAGDADGDGIDEKSHIMEEYPEATEELKATFAKGVANADIVPYSDRWGTFISGYAPLRDAKGKQVGILGVDLSAQDYQERLAGINEAFARAIGVSFLLALLSGLVAGAAQAKSIAIHKAAAKRDQKYREQIALTLERVESAIKIAEVSRNRFSDLFEGIPVSCLTFDRQECIFEWNSQALQTFNLDAGTLMERSLTAVLGLELYGTKQQAQISRVLQGKAFSDQVWTDNKRYFLFSGHPLFGPDGEISGGILAAVDISRQKDAEDRVQLQLEDLNKAHDEVRVANEKLREAVAQLEELATTDLLTGLPNRRAFYEVMQVALSRAERGEGFALVQADIDYFKLFNDVYGHHAGDEVLKLFARTVRESLRPNDFVARHGGEEFYIILQGADRTSALRIVERIRRNVAEIQSGFGQITASFGVALWTPEVTSDDHLMQATDDALYAAKREGRNRTVFGVPEHREAA